MCFNPHARVGRDPIVVCCKPLTFEGFNPHARVGRDEYEMLILLRIGVSIHTPVWGVTATNVVKVPDTKVSIHTPVWGVTKYKFFKI